MKALLERIESFRKPVNQEHVDLLISKLGDSPSIATIEEVLKHYKREEKKILTEDLLNWMEENDMTSLETEEYRVAIKTYVSAKMVDPISGFNWLTEHQYGDLIKTSVDFPKGEFSAEAQDTLEAMGLSFTRKDGVHPQTLIKAMRTRLEAGESMPDEDQGITVKYHDECQVKNK